jgi:hypothetical protein
MSSIQSYINELNQIKAELERTKKANAILKKRAAVLEQEIINFLEVKEQPGLKFRNQNLFLEEKVQKLRKSEKVKSSDLQAWLKDKGISDTKKAYKEIQNLQKGESVEIKKIKITNIDKK